MAARHERHRARVGIHRGGDDLVGQSLAAVHARDSTARRQRRRGTHLYACTCMRGACMGACMHVPCVVHAWCMREMQMHVCMYV